MTRVKVGIRARPLTLKEISSGDEVIIEVSGNNIVLKNRASEQKQRERVSRRCEEGRHFKYDYCFWSVDSWHPLFASQETIYNAIGVPVVNSLLEGYNACVFAYGQSGTGKSYTINGNDSEQGLLPRLCSDLLAKIHQLANATSVIEVSFVELYKEKVRDLLNFEIFNENLRVREHPSQGPFVEGLTKHRVTDVNHVTQLFEKSKNHFLPKEYLKRSHSIFTIRCLQECNSVVLSSELHLVDLAGSERTSLSSDFKDQQEIININKSLVTLGIVISSLANRINESLRPNFVPFRNSVLTWLLKETLGGNCVTCMIATVSPASSSYKETLNTLRYAERAGSICNKPIVNETSKTGRFLMREMKTETELSKKTLASTYFTQGIILENVISPYSPSKPTDAFNPFINKDYFEKLEFDNRKGKVHGSQPKHFEMNNNTALSESPTPLSKTELITRGRQPSLNNDLNNKLFQPSTRFEPAIEIKLKKPRQIISKSCENISSPDVLPLWKRFSRSLQDRERIENKNAGRSCREMLKSIEPLPLSVLKMFKTPTESTDDDCGRVQTPRDFDLFDNLENVAMIEEETDSMLGSWCSSEVESIMSNSGHGPIENNAETCKLETVEFVPEDGLNLVRTFVEEIQVLPTCTSPRSLIRACAVDVPRLSESVCSSVDTYNDSLNTPRNNLSDVEDGLTTITTTLTKPQLHQRRRSSYSTDSVEGCNNVTSEEEEVEKSRRTYINYVTNSSNIHYSTLTDERKVPFTLARDPGTPDSGFVSTKVFPGTPSLWRNNGDTPRTLEEGQASGSSSDSITYVFVDQSLSKNSRNNSEERSSAESSRSPEVNSVIEIPKLTREDSIVTLDSLEVWKDAANSPRTLSVDSLVMEQYWRMVNDANPDFERRGDASNNNKTRSVRSKVSPRVDSIATTSESSESSRKSSKNYGSDLVKLMSDVVQLLKSNNSESQSRNKKHRSSVVRGNNSTAIPTVYHPFTSSSSGTSFVSDTERIRCARHSRDSKDPNDGCKDSFETLEADEEYRNVMKISLKKEIRLIRKERDMVYRLLQKEKRKNSARNSSSNDKNNVKSFSKIRVEDSTSSFPEASSTASSKSSTSTTSSDKGPVIKSDFDRHWLRRDIPEDLTQFSRQLATKGTVTAEKKKVVLNDGAVGRQRSKYSTLLDERLEENNQQRRSFDQTITGDHSKNTDISRDLHDSGLVDCCSGYLYHSSFHETDNGTAGVDKAVQTRLSNAMESVRPKNRMTSSPNFENKVVSGWQKPWLSTVKPKRSSKSGNSPWSSDLSFLDDLLGPDIYLELPEAFSRSESFAIPLPSRFC